MCLYRAVAMMTVLRHNGFNASLNAGSAFWYANDLPEPHHTHFGHQWQNLPLPLCFKYIAIGVLPEIHCWAVIPELELIVDPATKFVKDIAEEKGIQWDKETPPDCLWATVDSMPLGWHYEPTQEATEFIHLLLPNILKQLKNKP